MTTFRPRVTLAGFACLLLFYLVFSALYHVVLEYLSSGRADYEWRNMLSVRDYWWNAGLQYGQYLLLSLLLWAAVIWAGYRLPQWVQILAVAVLVPPLLLLVRGLRYDYLDRIGHWHLEGTSGVWDLYIPLLFLYFQFGCYFAYAAIRDNQRKRIVEGELRQAALRSELAAIKAQLNPHFLYNVFNTINASLPPGSETAREMVSRLADLFRYQLRASREDLVPLADELAFTRDYLALEHARFGDRLRVELNVADHLLDRPVPPMLLQPVVENSVKHGLASLVEGGSVIIDVFERAGRLRFRIADTGVGVADKEGLFKRGVGLANTRLRLQRRYGTALEVFDNAPSGLVVQFSL